MWAYFNLVVDECMVLLQLAVPAVISNFLEGSMVMVDIMMLGRLGKGQVAALSIGNAFFNISWYFLEGFLTAQDTLASSAHGLGDPASVRQWSYLALAWVLLLCAGTSVACILAEPILGELFMLPYHLKTKAAVHVYLLLPGLWFLAASRVLQKYLQAQQVMSPGIVASLVGNGVNILGNYVFIYVFGFGFAGCGLATTVARLASLVVLLRIIWKRDEFGVIVRELKGHGRDPAVSAVCSRVGLVGAACAQVVGCSLQSCCPSVHAAVQRQYDYLASVEEEDGEEEGVQLVGVGGGRAGAGGTRVMRGFGAGPGGTSGCSKGSNRDISKRSEKDMPYKRDCQPSSPNGGKGGEDDDSDSSSGGSSSGEESREARIERKQQPQDKRSKLSPASLTTPASTHEDTSLPPSIVRRRRLLGLRALRLALLGLPGGLMLGLEGWVFVALSFFVAQMGTVCLATHEIMASFSMFVFLSLPFAVSVAATLRVSHLLATRPLGPLSSAYHARASCMICLALSAVPLAASGALVYYVPQQLGALFTGDQDIINRLGLLAPTLAGFQICYGLQGVCQGILRGMGRQLEVAGFTLMCLWGVGLPTGLYMGFWVRPTYGFDGIWWGLLVGMGCLDVSLVLLVLLVDWPREARRALLRADMTLAVPREDGSEGGGSSVEDDGTREARWHRNPLYSSVPLVGLPAVGSLARGGFPLHMLSLREELDELEAIEGVDEDEA